MDRNNVLTAEMQLLQAQIVSAKERNEVLAKERELAHAAVMTMYQSVVDSAANRAGINSQTKASY